MKTHFSKKTCVSILSLFVSGTLSAQSLVQIDRTDAPAGEKDIGDASGLYTIFSNLDPNHDPYKNDGVFDMPVVGRQVIGMTEQWNAVRFVPKVDVQATVLEAAVGYISGSRDVMLSLYDNNDTFQTPGSLLPGAQGSTTKVPDLAECCQMVRVTLSQPVTLTAGTIYWLVASAGSSDFNGTWRPSYLGDRGVLFPPNPWLSGGGEWPAARVRGARLETLGPLNRVKQDNIAFGMSAAAAAKVKIFSNLTSAYPYPYTTGVGIQVVGNDVQLYDEEWLALPFTSPTDVQAKTLAAAIARLQGTAKINLTLYSDGGGLPAAPLTDGQGSTTDIPDSGQCCDFATVRLPGNGVALSANIQYWLVVSPSTDAEDFMGIWQFSTNNIWARLYPEQSQLWTAFSGDWMAAQIVGRSE